ncbi:MAG: hypothetical protein DRO04_01075 [Candidatus Iainarchaeum archaeon]|uniref:Uncharacterized protein n=1 Tax=Candidatus Iainarchaeum sp. TaxID=3101447 RepID=A0A497JJ53_9ARCH|nr:MAG: hypothetical protein DRO04_01075 [Candidatus Diapherotrites archaeon]
MSLKIKIALLLFTVLLIIAIGYAAKFFWDLYQLAVKKAELAKKDPVCKGRTFIKVSNLRKEDPLYGKFGKEGLWKIKCCKEKEKDCYMIIADSNNNIIKKFRLSGVNIG